jgi:phosphoserine phosphatase RsbU/P
MNILLAEDDLASQQLLLIKLRDLGHHVVTASDGEAAWQLQMENNFPVVVSDWNMPLLDGIEFCRKVRTQKLDQYVYFILQTARTEKEDYRQAMAEGVDDFLPKPVDLQELAIRLRVAERIISYKTQIRKLRALLPICMYCKKVRNDQAYWQQVETYFHQIIGADFSHGVCPSCYDLILVPQETKSL